MLLNQVLSFNPRLKDKIVDFRLVKDVHAKLTKPKLLLVLAFSYFRQGVEMREVVSGTLLKSNNIVYVLGAIGPKQD